VDQLIEAGVIREPVFAQTGHSDYVPRHFSWTPFLPKAEFEEKISRCRLLITHSGVGTIITGIKNKKPTIVYPRLAKYAEHVDDHQLEIATAFAEKNLVLLCGDGDDLADRIREAMGHSFSPYHSQRENMIATIRGYLDTV
jgi:UDP-N-acetylglucosamine transferase subunit ALG13